MAYRSFPLYNLSASVGKGGVNRPDDVRLIQVMISSYTGSPNMQVIADRCKEYRIAAPKAPAQVTGQYNDELGAWILLLQHMAKRMAGTNNACDGRIDPLPLERNTLDFASENKSGKEYFLIILIRSYIKKDARGYLSIADRVGLPYELYGSDAVLNV